MNKVMTTNLLPGDKLAFCDDGITDVVLDVIIDPRPEVVVAKVVVNRCRGGECKREFFYSGINATHTVLDY